MAIKPPTKGKSNARNSKSKASSTSLKKSPSKAKGSRPPPKQMKTKPGNHNPKATAKGHKKKQREYTDVELNLPALNSITPASAASQSKGSGKKKNKIYVDDKESMMTILALVNAEKEGQIESKMMKMRQMEEVREARRIEAEKREEERRQKLEVVKRGLKERKGSGSSHDANDSGQAAPKPREDRKHFKGKTVSFT